jgi:hypothetical protein
MIKRRNIMKVLEFIENYNAKRFMNTKQGVDERVEWIRNEIGVKEYLPFAEKQTIAKTVLAECASIEDGVIAIDSVDKYISFTMAMLATYTVLEPDEDVTLSEEYDALCSIRVEDGTLLDAIIKTFEVEYVRCNDILNMMTADLLAENNIEKQIGKFLSNLSDKISKFGDGLIDKIGDMNMDLNQLDIDKLINMIGKIK